jgi:tRNA(Ile)-lysidine synthase TilS/MesJ
VKNNQTCIRCVNDKTVKKIKFNKDGLCSHCTCYDRYKSKLKDYNALENLFLQKITKEGDYDYDVALGFSGGKDSTFVLYKLVKDYKLKVKAFTVDNGFLSSEAKEKIMRTVNELSVDHEFVKCDLEILRKTYKYTVSR